jgi:hypothetical protein
LVTVLRAELELVPVALEGVDHKLVRDQQIKDMNPQASRSGATAESSPPPKVSGRRGTCTGAPRASSIRRARGQGLSCEGAAIHGFASSPCGVTP